MEVAGTAFGGFPSIRRNGDFVLVVVHAEAARDHAFPFQCRAASKANCGLKFFSAACRDFLPRGCSAPTACSPRTKLQHVEIVLFGVHCRRK